MFRKLGKAFRKHPKKSIIFATVLGIGTNYLNKRYEDKQLLRSFCIEALKYGEEPLPVSAKERHITVLLNPAANNGKCKAQYNKYCAPLLHLAGLKVALVRTEHEGQAKEIANIVENTDAVLIAGGDGLLSEVLTGILRRDKSVVKNLPIGIIPLGERNVAASSIWGFKGKASIREVAEATMAVIKQVTCDFDVMEVTQLEADSDSKPIYAASELEWGPYREARERRGNYWYWGPLKKYITYIFSSYKDLTWNCNADLEWSLPCSGCNRCVEQEIQTKEKSRWWHSFLQKKTIIEEEIDYSSKMIDECGRMYNTVVKNVSDLRISTRNTPSTKDMPGYALALKLGPENIKAIDFIKEGWKEEDYKETAHSVQHMGTIFLKPNIITDDNDKKKEYGIDNEIFDIRPVKIRAIPKAVKIFCPKQEFS